MASETKHRPIRPQWKAGAKVTHWFRGDGTVIGNRNGATVKVRFADGDGVCYRWDLQAREQ